VFSLSVDGIISSPFSSSIPHSGGDDDDADLIGTIIERCRAKFGQTVGKRNSRGFNCCVGSTCAKTTRRGYKVQLPCC
jgi:hypothetical protein